MANARLGWFSPLGATASIRRWPSVSRAAAGRVRFSARRVDTSAFRFGDCRSAGSFFRLPFRSCRSASWPSGSRLPLFGTHRFGVAAGRVRSFAFHFGNCPRRVALRAHCFRFSACAASGLPSAGWFFRLPLRRLPSAGWPSGSRLPFFGLRRFGNCPRRVGLRTHCFRFSARTASEWPLGELVFPPSASEIAAGRVGLRVHCFRFSACTASELPSAGWPSGSPLPLFGTHRFGVAAGRVRSSAFRFGDCPRRVGSSAGRVGLRAHGFRFSARTASEWPLGELAFGLTASAFRHALLRSGRWASSFFRLPLRSGRSAGWPSGSLLPLFGMYRSAPLRRRSEDRRSTPTRHLFHFKTLIPTC